MCSVNFKSLRYWILCPEIYEEYGECLICENQAFNFTCGNTGLDLVGKREEFQAFIYIRVLLLVTKFRPS
jgi:hypothetical protein